MWGGAAPSQPALLRGPPPGEPRDANSGRQQKRGPIPTPTAHPIHRRTSPASNIALVVVAGTPARMGGMTRIAACRAARQALGFTADGRY